MLGLNPWMLLGGLVLVLALMVSGYAKGRHDANASWELRVAAQEREARVREHNLQEKADAIRNQLEQDKAAVSAQLVSALDELRNRPERLPAPARAACKGGTGAELSRPDAGFLTREAARADSLRAELQACYAREDAWQAAVNNPQP